MNTDFKYGYPIKQCEEIINDALNSNWIKSKYPVEYQGTYQELQVIEVPIEMPLYRVQNIRTKNKQKEWLAERPDVEKSFFTADPYSIAVQMTQHELLKDLVMNGGEKDKIIFKEFQKEKQTEPIICSSKGVVVNGNRRLCVWRDLYYNNPTKYPHFQVVRIAVLPNHNEKAMYDLEIQLQVKKDIKAEYAWHAIAADCYEKQEMGYDIDDIAKKQGKDIKEIIELIECYEYAKDYLDKCGKTDKWSLVDEKLYAFKSIVSTKKKITDSGDIQLFEELAYSILQVPAKGERLYSKIPKVEKNLKQVKERLLERYEINTDEDEDDDLLIGGKKTSDSASLARSINQDNNPEKVVEIIEKTIEDCDELAKEQKKKSFVFDQVFKAATCLRNAAQQIVDQKDMNKEGVAKQLNNIEVDFTIIKNWVENDR